jgi:hypothetical protein
MGPYSVTPAARYNILKYNKLFKVISWQNIKNSIAAARNLYLSFSVTEITSAELKKVCEYCVETGDKHIQYFANNHIMYINNYKHDAMCAVSIIAGV